MKLTDVNEASYHGQAAWYVFDGSSGDYSGHWSDLVGPFKTKQEAEQFCEHMENTFGHMEDDHVPVIFNFELHQVVTPQKYVKDIEEHHRDMNS